ncbi:MAG: SprT-like domain-containing protein [Lachnospiraceae bacterium]|nr:SprT-like domain-containing protein [Lachnospiraceae bacterium]
MDRQNLEDSRERTQEEYLEQTVRECEEQLRAIKIPIGHIAGVSVNTRARRRWGLCRKEADGFYISISKRLLNEDTKDGLRNTIMHELLHTCPMCSNHGAMWKHYAEYVNQTLGMNIKRVNSNEDKGLPPDEEIRILHKYHCDGCGQVVTKQRECKFTRNYKDYKCSLCGGRFIRDF